MKSALINFMAEAPWVFSFLSFVTLLNMFGIVWNYNTNSVVLMLFHVVLLVMNAFTWKRAYYTFKD